MKVISVAKVDGSDATFPQPARSRIKAQSEPAGYRQRSLREGSRQMRASAPRAEVLAPGYARAARWVVPLGPGALGGRRFQPCRQAARTDRRIVNGRRSSIELPAPDIQLRPRKAEAVDDLTTACGGVFARVATCA